MTDYDKELSKLERESFEKAVALATEQATQNISAIHRRRLVRHTSLMVGSICAAVAVVVILWINSNTTSARKSEQQKICNELNQLSQAVGSGNNSLTMEQLQPNGARIKVRAGFISSDAFLRQSQQLDTRAISRLHNGALKKLLVDPQTVSLEAKSQILDKETFDFWSKTLVPYIDQIAQDSCS